MITAHVIIIRGQIYMLYIAQSLSTDEEIISLWLVRLGRPCSRLAA